MAKALKKIGRYKILGELGRGAMGVVYKAEDPNLDRTVALKTISLDKDAEGRAEYQKRFLVEAKAAGKLNHPHIVTTFDFGEADGMTYLEQARARGERFDLIISDPPSFAPNERAKPRAIAAYRKLHAALSHVLADGGILCAASCSSHVGPAEFQEAVASGIAAAGRRAVMVHVRGAGPDHPVLPAFPEGRYLKFLVLAVSGA